jgi:hypothetical protein
MSRVCFLVLAALLLSPGPATAAEPFRFPEARHGKGELKYVKGVPVLYLAGKPEEIGEQMGVLALRHAAQFGDAVQGTVKAHAGDVGWALATRLADGIFAKFPEEYRQEVEAMARAGKVDRDVLVVANTIWDLRGLRLQQGRGCAGLAVEPARSATGGPLLGRNMDTPALGKMSEIGLVVVCRPDGKQPFVAPGFPGLLVCMCGMNAAGLALGCDDATGAADGAPTFSAAGVPSLVAQRRVLEGCKTIEEAEKWLRAHPSMVQGVVPACDLRAAVVVEVTPKTVAVRKATDGLVCCTNHFLADGLRVGDDCPRLRALEKARQLKALSVADVAARMHAANQGEWTLHTMVFEPKRGVLHVAFGHGKKSATEFPLAELDLSAALKP